MLIIQTYFIFYLRNYIRFVASPYLGLWIVNPLFWAPNLDDGIMPRRMEDLFFDKWLGRSDSLGLGIYR